MGKPGPDSDGRSAAEEPAPDTLDRLAEDWITLWQTELAGLSADPDWIALSQHSMAMGAAWLRLLGAMATPPAGSRAAADDGAAHAPARPAPPAAPSGADDTAGRSGAGDGGDRDAAGGADMEAALRRRLAELERRLAALERGTRRGRADRPSPRRRRPSA